MAYPTGLLSIVLEDIDRRAAGIKLYVSQVKAEAAAGNIPSTRILDVFINLKQERVALAAATSTAGLPAYAQAQKNQPGLDVVAEFNAMTAAIDGVTSWIVNNFPKDAGGILLERTWGASSPVDRTFTPTQTAGFRTVLDTLIATIA